MMSILIAEAKDPKKQSYELRLHLQCLQDCIRENELFRDDLKRLKLVSKEASEIVRQCCPKQAPARDQAECC